MLLAPLHECPHGSRPPGAPGPPRVPQRRYRQGKDEPGGAPRAGGTALRAPAPSPPLSPRRPLSPSPDHPGAPTHLCARRGSSEASPPAPHRPPGEAGDGSGGRRTQQGQGEQQPPLAGGCSRQAPRCPQHRHLARAAAQGIVGRRRTRGRGGAGRREGKVARGAMAAAAFGCTQSHHGGTTRGCRQTHRGGQGGAALGLLLSFCERGCSPPWCPEMGSFEHSDMAPREGQPSAPA